MDQNYELETQINALRSKVSTKDPLGLCAQQSMGVMVLAACIWRGLCVCDLWIFVVGTGRK